MASSIEGIESPGFFCHMNEPMSISNYWSTNRWHYRSKITCQTGHIGHILRTVWRDVIELPVHDVTYDNILGSLSNDDAYGDENGKKAKGLISKTTTLHAFLYLSLPSLPDYNVKVPEFTFGPGREHKTTTFFSFPGLWYSPLEFNSKNICQHLTK